MRRKSKNLSAEKHRNCLGRIRQQTKRLVYSRGNCFDIVRCRNFLFDAVFKIVETCIGRRKSYESYNAEKLYASTWNG